MLCLLLPYLKCCLIVSLSYFFPTHQSRPFHAVQLSGCSLLRFPSDAADSQFWELTARLFSPSQFFCSYVLSLMNAGKRLCRSYHILRHSHHDQAISRACGITINYRGENFISLFIVRAGMFYQHAHILRSIQVGAAVHAGSAVPRQIPTRNNSSGIVLASVGTRIG